MVCVQGGRRSGEGAGGLDIILFLFFPLYGSIVGYGYRDGRGKGTGGIFIAFFAWVGVFPFFWRGSL